MTIDEVLQHFSTGYKVCKELNLTHTNFYKWKQAGFIPVKQQTRINRYLGINLPIDIDKDEMLRRLARGN